MMLVISVLRYRATVHPLKPAITRRKLKVVCGLVYVVGLIGGYGPIAPECLLISHEFFLYITNLLLVTSYSAITFSQQHSWL